MHKIFGTVKDKKERVLNGVTVSLMNEYFEDVATTFTNENGKYILEAESRHYPYLIIVRDYAEKFLEYWCQNISLNKDIEINCAIDKLEIYGLHCFKIKGASPALTVYFRPMSLEKQLNGEIDIVPRLKKEQMTVHINAESSKVFVLNEVKEYSQDMNMTAYLMQVSLPEKYYPVNENFIDIRINDEHGNYGQASMYF